ncbi:MAG TPA: hypothetical protein VH333_06965 [Pseudonocardiaceae bacterium]|jgi:hypothetical protein|nr:hypothetical protein [Pseudonocardiaceae bacterium]
MTTTPEPDANPPTPAAAPAASARAEAASPAAPTSAATSAAATSAAATSAAATPAATSITSDLPILELGRGWPGWVPRAILLLAGLGAAAALLADNANSIALGFVLLFALVVPLVPATPAPAILIAGVAVAVAAGGGDPLRPTVLFEIPLLHLVHLTASFAALVPVRAVVRPAALWRPARRFLVVQALTFAVVGVAALLPTGRNPAVVEVAGLIASTALVVLAVWLVVRRR